MPKARSLRLALVALALVPFLLPRPLAAQAVSGTILGTVRDTTGAGIAGAKVTLTHVATNRVRTVVTDAAGEYVAPLLPTGTYSISAEMTGFKTVTLSNVRLGVDQKVRMDPTLEVGGITEVIQIEATTPLVQTSSSDLSATIRDVQIQTLPLNGRNFVQLTRTVPGIGRGTAGDNIDGSFGSYGWRMSAAFSANGQRTRDNNFLLDGVDNNEQWLNTVVIFPSVDALEEFKIQTSTYSAEFGRSLGGVVNLQIRSGTNEFHGSAFEFLRNDKMDANDWFNNKNNRPRPDFAQHQFGATLGGPIIKDKTFFFVDYQGWRINQGLSMISTVPTDLMRAGDFSELNRVIYDPLSPGTPFAGNVIPPDRIDPAARNIIDQLYPPATEAGTRAASGQVINNYIYSPTMERRDHQFDVKVDHQLTTKNRFFVRYSFEKSHRFLPGALEHGDAGSNVAGVGSAGTGNMKAQSLAFNDIHTFNSRLLNEFRLGWNSIEILADPIDYGTNLAQQMGIPGINISQVSSAMMGLAFQNIRNLGPTSSQPLFSNGRTIHIVDNLTYTRSRHTFKAGVSLMFMKRDVLNAELATSQAVFNNNLTSNCAGIPSGCTVNAGTGFDLASFLLGYPASWDRRLYESAYTERRPQYGAYIQDDFRVTSKLTLNLGLRWDVFVPFVTDDDKQSNFDPSTGKFVVASEDAVIDGIEVGRYLQTYSKTDFAPRIGFAYDVVGSGRTILRGGFGMFWNSPMTGTSSSKAQNPPFLLSQNLTAGVVPNGKLSNGLPELPIVDPDRPGSGMTRSIFDPNFRDGYAQQWNVNVQQQLGKDYMFEVGYIGSRGRQAVVRKNINQAPPVLGVTNPNVNRPYYAINPALTDLHQNRSEGTLDYHALLVKFVRQFANGFSFYNSYTFGKAIDLDSTTDGLASFTNSYDYAYQRGPAAYDIRHTFTSNWIYELPFGRGHKLGGWQFSGILLLRSGYPLTVGQTQNVTSTGTGNRPDTIGDPKLADPTIDKWFDPAAYAMPTETSATYGNTGRNTIRGPGQFTVDLALIKVTRFGRVNTELRLEAFNALNHPVFGNPNTTIGNANVGKITALLPLTPMRQLQVGLKVSF